MIRLLAIGTGVGLVVLGLGGRTAMAAIQEASHTTPSRWTLGGTLTVMGLGAASGLAGATFLAGVRWLARRLIPAHAWVQYPVLAAFLLFITIRGLHGTASVGRLYFVLLVAAYSLLMIWLDRRWERAPAKPGLPAP